MTSIKAFFGALLAFLIIDAVWITLVVSPMYAREAPQLMLETPNMGAAAVFYLAYAAGIVILAVNPALKTRSAKTALINGGVLGGIAYGTYSITNYAVIDGWTPTLVISDVPWGIFLTAMCALAGFFAAGRGQNKTT